METDSHLHQPVLIHEVLDSLQPAGDDFIVDATFGRGGYTTAILGKLNENGRVLAFDVDPDAVAHGERVFASESRLTLAHKNYDELVETLEELGMPTKVNGIVFDLGVSSPQLDDASRGFSIRNDGPLDMRMDPHAGLTAAQWLQTVSYNELVRVISTLGEEKMAKRIAREIIGYRDKAVIGTTALLAEIISRAIPEKEKKHRKIHPATKTFQAIRMHINDELGHLKAGLTQAMNVLAAGGVVVVVTFHSLEDRIVKRMFRKSVEGNNIPDRLPIKQSELNEEFAYVAKLVRPGESELKNNPRARSAKLRAIRRLVL
jgi:16S rRNA (cytosine1402-N4)-methyltransferase